MELLTAIAIVRALAGAVEDGIPLAERAIKILKTSDEPEAQAALAELKAFYERTGLEADEALAARVRELNETP